ncbi:MAG: hypothetical protein KatS3mg129_1324 [Leptospiraceae bacterium]|nr:MAG: hypothetical protein KatS3mg129_1324 [Leptospiraceae bacterium]
MGRFAPFLCSYLLYWQMYLKLRIRINDIMKLNRFWSIVFVAIYGGVTLLLRFYFEPILIYDNYWLSIAIGIGLLLVIVILIKIGFLNFNE